MFTHDSDDWRGMKPAVTNLSYYYVPDAERVMAYVKEPPRWFSAWRIERSLSKEKRRGLAQKSVD